MSGIIIGIISGIAGVIIGLCTPWVKWKIEKRRKKQDARRQLIKKCKEIVDNPDFDANSFVKTNHYSSIREELPEKLRKEIENLKSMENECFNIKMAGRDVGVNVYRSRILDEIVKIEKKWDLF